MEFFDLLLHMTLIDGIGPHVTYAVVDTFSPRSDAVKIYSYTAQEFVDKCGLSHKGATKLVNGLADKRLFEEEKERLGKHDIEVVTFYDEEYPSLLREIYAPPVVLYIKGRPLTFAKGIGVIGSRKANLYGRAAIERIVPSLVLHDWAIVSGGALGADTMAHEAALAHKGRTISVLGSGLLELYPASNRRLFNEIVDSGGTLVSPYPLTTTPSPGNFPARNRIISGLSLGCIVIQAASRSGASITASLALEQGRDVFAVPGPIDDPLSAGCHNLIQQGAKLVANAQDILIEYNEFKVEHDVQTTIPEQSEGAQSEPSHFATIVALCKKPTTFDDLQHRTNYSADELRSYLFELQLSGDISQLHSGLWQSAQ